MLNQLLCNYEKEGLSIATDRHQLRYRFTFKAVNPGYQGGIIESISMKQIKNAYNIFYIK